MGYFTFDLKKVVIVILVVVIPLVTISLRKDKEETPWFFVPFTLVGGVMQNSYSVFSSGVRSTTSMYMNLIDIKKQNVDLNKENSEFRTQLGAMTELKLENERMNKLLEFKQKRDMELLAAKVIGNDLLPNHSSISINRGSGHGVKKFMAAITSGGVVGYVADVEEFSAQVLLLTDRYSAIDAIVQRSRARGIVEGKSKEACKLSYLQRSDDVQEGDLVVTSGLDNIFPKGFPIGQVVNVKKTQYGMSQSVEIKPTVNPFTLEEIFIVLNAHHENFLGDENAADPENPGSSSSTQTLESGDVSIRSLKE